MSRRRVHVTGFGAITPLGETWAESIEPLAQGRSAVKAVEHFDVANFPCTVAASISRQFDHTSDRRLALAQRAAREAWAMADVDAPSERCATICLAPAHPYWVPGFRAIIRPFVAHRSRRPST